MNKILFLYWEPHFSVSSINNESITPSVSLSVYVSVFFPLLLKFTSFCFGTPHSFYSYTRISPLTHLSFWRSLKGLLSESSSEPYYLLINFSSLLLLLFFWRRVGEVFSRTVTLETVRIQVLPIDFDLWY